MTDPSSTLRLDTAVLRKLMVQQLLSRDVVEAAASNVTEALVEASLRGVDSHGINLYPHYCRVAVTDRIHGAPNMKLTVDEPSCAVLDADHAFGHHAGAHAMDVAVSKAKSTGAAVVAVSNSSHFGSAAYYGLKAARAGMIGMAFTNADPLVKAHGSTDSFFGTNPICFAVPMRGEEPLCLDMATSCTSWNNIKNHRLSGESLEPGWAYDASGSATTDPHDARSLAPIGSYKGFGLGLMVEVFCSLLSDMPLGVDVLPMYESLDQKRYVSHCFVAVDIARFTDVSRFAERMRVMADRIRALPAMDAAAPSMVAGDPQKNHFEERSRRGIPMTGARFAQFLEVSASFEEARIREEGS